MNEIIQKILKLPDLLGRSCEEIFCKRVKRYYIDTGTYSVFCDGNEYMFIDDHLHSIELYSYSTLFTHIEDVISLLNQIGVYWAFYSKYTYDKYLVIKIQSFVYFEYSFNDEGSTLSLIRISDKE